MRDPYDLVHRTLDRRYAIRRVVAEGGFGVVYEAEAIALGIKVAIKVLRSDVLSSSPEARARFQQEARLLARLRHPGIVTLTDAAHLDDGTPYLALEWIDGETLDAYLARVGPLPLDDALRLLGPVASAITYAHEQGVVHRDLKPGNVMIPRGSPAKVLDFGVARWTAPQGLRTSTTANGTGLSIGYAAPEQYGKQFGPVDGRADQFALAAVIFAALTGKAPFAADSVTEVMFATCMAPERPSVASLRPDLPRAVDAVLRRALAIRPEDRYPTIRDFFAALEEAARHGDAPGSLPRAPETSPASPPTVRAAAAPPPVATLPSPVLDDAPRTLVSGSVAYAPTQPAPITGPAGTSPTGGGVPRVEDEREPPPSEVAPPSRASKAGRATFAIALVVALAGGGYAAWPLLRPSPPAPKTPAPKPAPSIGKSAAPSADAGAPQGPCGKLADDEVCIVGARISRGPEDCSTSLSDWAHQAACPSVGVDVKTFALDKYEVSAARWAQCVEAGKCRALEMPGDPSLPARGVTHEDATAFCAWAKRRLPTDDEWELAAAGPEDRQFPWGNLPADPSRAVFGVEAPLAVDAAKNGETPQGVLHLAGNVAEWTATAAHADAPWPFGLERDDHAKRFWVRGGGYDSPWGALRSWAREAYPATHVSPSIGFRCARTVR